MPPLRQRVEIGLVAAATVVLALLDARLPRTVAIGSLVAVSAILLLLQGFVRDLWLRHEQRRQKHPAALEEAHCMCLESTLGLTSILVGVALTVVGFDRPLALSRGAWPVLAAAIWTLGFGIRDVVLQWRPWAIRRVRNHGSIVVRWR